MSVDDRIETLIEQLEAERRALQRAPQHDDAARARESEIKVDLDRLWDWKRQRRALRDAGRDPNEAHERDASIVERYLQ